MNNSKQQRQISFRVSPTEADIIKQSARVSGKQQSDWLRLAVLSAVDTQSRGSRSLEEKIELQLLHTSFLFEVFMQHAKGKIPNESEEYLSWCRRLYNMVEINLKEKLYLSCTGEGK